MVQSFAGPLQVRLSRGTLGGMFKDLHHPFFVPLGRRVAVVCICAAWALFEFAAGAPTWGLMVAALGGYAGFGFFVAWNPPQIPSSEEGDD